MKIISFVEARQDKVIRKILEHCGLWRDPPPRAAANPPQTLRPVQAQRASGFGDSVEVDPDFLEHLHREKQGEQLNLGWDFLDKARARSFLTWSRGRGGDILRAGGPRAVLGQQLRCS